MTDLEINYNEFSSESTGQASLGLCTAVVSSNGSVSISQSQTSISTLNDNGQCETWAMQVVSWNSTDENTTYADSGVENYLSATGMLSPIDSHPGYYYVVLPKLVSSSSEVLSYVANALEKPRNFEIIIKSDNLPPK